MTRPEEIAVDLGEDLGEVETYEPEELDEEADPDADPDDPFHRGHRERRHTFHMPGQDIGHLNLVPMMDIMTMLLVFLVMSFATEPGNINVNLVRPPESTAEKVLEPATSITITRDTILVEDKEVMKIAEIAEPGQGSVPQIFGALFERAEWLKGLEQLGGPPFDGRLLIVAHETTPYAVITSALVSAGEAQFSEYKLVLMSKAEAPAAAP